MSGVDYEGALDTGDSLKNNRAVTIRLTSRSGGEDTAAIDEVETVPVTTAAPHQPMARVGFSSGMTLNLGNYESARLEVSISMPCDVSEVEETYEYCKRFVEEKGEALLAENDLKK